MGQVLAVGTPTNYAEIITGVQTLLQANVAREAIRFAIMSPRSWAKYAGLVTGISSDLSPLPKPPAIADIQFLVTSNVPNNLGSDSPPDDSAIIMGDFRDLLMGVRQEASIRILDSTTSYPANLLLDVVALIRLDFLVTRPASFVTLEGVDD